jgi:hypothetical protein
MKAGNMAKLKLIAIPDEKPVKMTFELPASTHRDLLAYAEAIAQETGQPVADPARLIAPMLARFMATDRAFSIARKRGLQNETSSVVDREAKTSIHSQSDIVI